MVADLRPAPRPSAGDAREGASPPLQTSIQADSRTLACRPRWHSTELFGRAQEIEIEHGQAVYRLRRTSLGKLILTK